MFLFFAVIAVLLGTAHSQTQTPCIRLPTEGEIQFLIRSIVTSASGEGSVGIVILLSHHFTCIAPTQRMGEIQEVSIAVVFNVISDMGVTDTRRGQVQLQCSGVNNLYQGAISALEENPPAVAFTLTTREDCFLCVPSGPPSITVDTDANCAVCPSRCGELGNQNRCYSSPTAVCCPVYENGMCVDMCSTNRTASAATNFTCVCRDGFVEISATQCRSLCDSRPNSCQNGGNCIASGNSTMCSCPPQYTGVNCENPGVMFILYVRYSTKSDSMISSGNFEYVGTVVMQMIDIISSSFCRNVPERPIDTGKERTECTFVGFTSQMQSQSISSSVASQVITLLRTHNISAPGTENTSELGFCNYESTVEGSRGMFHWNESIVNATAHTNCFYGPAEVMATRHCISRDIWGVVFVDLCRTVISEQLSAFQQINVTQDNVNSVVNNVTNIVASANQTSDQNSDNLKIVANVLTQTAQVVQTQNVSLNLVTQVTKNTVQILENVQEWPMEVIQQQNNEIVQAYDSIVDALISQVNFTNISVVQLGIGLIGERIEQVAFQGRTLAVDTEDSKQQLQLFISDASSMIELSSNLSTTFSLPKDIVRNIQEGNDIRVAFTVLNSPALFPVGTSSHTTNISDTVVGSQVISVQVNEIANGEKLAAPVSFSLRLINSPPLEEVQFIAARRCAFWDFEIATTNGRGDWNTTGCTLMAFNELDNVVSCECDHLTNFACLVDISIRINPMNNVTAFPEEFLLALNVTTIVGVVFSLVGLLLLILTHLIFKKIRQRDVTKFHVQLAGSIILMLIVFVAGINRTEHRVGCITVGVLLHYLILVIWMWMGAEAILLFQKVVIVFKQTTTLYIVIISLVCWFVPFIPVIISVSLDPSNYIVLSTNTTKGFCFIRDTGVFFGAFLGPIILLIILNTLIFLCIGIVITKFKINKEKMKAASEQKHRMSSKEICKLLVSLTGFMVLLGLSWTLMLFTIVGVATNVYAAFTIQLLFNFFNSFQGFFLFVFFVALSPDARNSWKQLFLDRFKRRLYSLSASQNYETKSTNKGSSKEASLMQAKSVDKVNVSINITTIHDENESQLPFNSIVDNSATEERSISTLDQKIRIHRTSTRRKTHHVEVAVVKFAEYDSDSSD